MAGWNNIELEPCAVVADDVGVIQLGQGLNFPQDLCIGPMMVFLTASERSMTVNKNKIK